MKCLWNDKLTKLPTSPTTRINIGSLKPYLYQFLGRVLPQLVGIGISSVIVKNAGVDVFGQYSLLLGLIAITYQVLGLALDTDFQRSCDAAKVPIVLFAKIIVWVIVLPVLLLIALFVDTRILTLMVLFGGILIRQFIETRVINDRILEKDASSVFPRLLPVVIFLVMLYLVRPISLNGIVYLFTLCWMTGLIFIAPLCRNVKWDISHSFRSIRGVAPIWLSLLVTQVYGNVDLYVIKLYHSDEVVGIYKLAYTFASMTMPVAGVFIFIFLSKISAALREKDIDCSKVIIRQQFLINTFLGVGLILFMIVLFPYIALHLYGEVGLAAVVPARILAVAMMLNMLTMVYSYVLLALHMEKVIARMTAVGAILFLAMAFALIPEYAANGAAAAMIMTYLSLLASYYWFYRKRLVCDTLTIESAR